MGHERLGLLPQSRQWRELVDQLDEAAGSDEVLAAVATTTLRNVRRRFETIHADHGVQAALGFLIGLSTSHLPAQEAGLASPPLRLSENPSPIELTAQLEAWVDQHAQSFEYAELAKRAAASAIAYWTRSQSRQGNLFDCEVQADSVWRAAASGASFSEVSRIFFAKFIERYLKYFLDREASAQLTTLRRREEFAARLTELVDDLSQHAFSTSQITQSFAAGWYNKKSIERRPTNREIVGFLGFAFGKLRQELQREEAK